MTATESGVVQAIRDILTTTTDTELRLNARSCKWSTPYAERLEATSLLLPASYGYDRPARHAKLLRQEDTTELDIVCGSM